MTDKNVIYMMKCNEEDWFYTISLVDEHYTPLKFNFEVVPSVYQADNIDISNDLRNEVMLANELIPD